MKGANEVVPVTVEGLLVEVQMVRSKLFVLSPFLFICAAFPATQQQQTPPREQPDIVAINFGWVRQSTRLIRGAQNPGGPITTPIPADTRDLGSRKAELRNTDKQATLSVDKHGNTYHLFLEFKNIGTNVVRSLIWEFRPTVIPADYAPKQYLCALRIKPREKKTLDLWTSYAPVKVINANARRDGLKEGEVIINKVEYVNGSVWQKGDWRYSLPPDSTEKLGGEGKCAVFDS
jgi:hypothetical protein